MFLRTWRSKPTEFTKLQGLTLNSIWQTSCGYQLEVNALEQAKHVRS
jgi:hypothetical protein